MTLRVETGGLDRPEIARLVKIHLDEMHANSPKCHVFALDDSGLRDPAVTLVSAWNGETCLGIGALKALSDHEGEIKSMRTDPAATRRGVAKLLLEGIVDLARGRGYRRIFLETGSGAYFDPAIALYRRYGFVPSGPFADYEQSDFNQFFCMELTDEL